MAFSSPTQDFIVTSGLTVQGTSVVTSSTSNTGALQVNSGAAIAQNLIVGTTATVLGQSQLNTVAVLSSTSSTNTATGALVVTGGVGVGGEIHANDIYSNGYLVLTSAGNGLTLTAGTDTKVSTSTGNIIIWNTGTFQTITSRGATTNVALSITNTSNSDSTFTGAFIVTGGVGIGGNLYASNMYSNGSQVLVLGGPGFVSTVTAGTDTAISTSSGAVTVWNTSTLQTITSRGSATSNAISFTNTSSSTSTTTGALVVTGGVGIGNSLYVGNSATIFGTNASTSTIQNNALYVAGGVGIGTSLYVTGEAVFTNNVIFNGTTTYILTTNTVYTDNILELHYPNTVGNQWSVNDTKDIGLRFHFYDTQDRSAFLGRDNATGYLEWLSPSNGDENINITGTNGTFRTGSIILTSTTTATSTLTGALQVAGGVGVQGSLYAGLMFSNGYPVLTSQSGSIVNTIVAGTDTAINTSTGVVTIWNTSTLQTITSRGAATTAAITITNSTTSISTTTGALKVVGGAGFGDSVYVGNRVGFVSPTNVSAVYQFYNTVTNSLDTVFG